MSYAPNEEMLFSCIDEFISLIEEFQIEDVDENYRLEWIKEGNPLYRQGSGIWVNERNSYEWVEGEIHHEIQGYAKCLKHGLFLTYFGCHLCKS